MSHTKVTNETGTLRVFKEEKVMTLKQLATISNCCERTVQRRLKDWGTYTSYNQNGRYYVLPDIPKFDQNGLWRHKGICFSKYGNLRQTVINLVTNSQTGLTAKEIEDIMGLSPNSLLSYFRNLQQLRREKIDGCFVYFLSDKAIFIKQKQNRQKNSFHAKLMKIPSDAEAVVVLVERIKYPDLSIEQLSMRLSKKGYQTKAEVIRNFFISHGLLKKTQVTQP